jgi:hypothetical protein
MRFPALFLALCLPRLGTTVVHASGVERVDRVVAVVGDRVVTGWDLRLEEALDGHIGCPEPLLCSPEQTHLERLVDRALIRGLAGDTATYRPSSEDLELRMGALRASFEQPEEYRFVLASLGLDEGNLAGLVFSRMVVERYVQRHVTLPVRAAGGDEEEQALRYRSWIAEQRAQVRSRLVEPEGEASPPLEQEP